MSDCCTPDGSCKTTTAAEGTSTEGTTTVYRVSGMTCGHCRTAITNEVSPLAGVRAVEVDLEAGTVAVTTDGEPDDKAVAAAIDEAGYELTGRVETAAAGA
jgi:copper chaperone CopZ